MRSLLLVLLALLPACSSSPALPVVIPKEVLVPVAVRCKVRFPEAPIPLNLDSLGPDLHSRVIALIHEGDSYRLYSAELLAALRSCADDAGSP